MNHEQEQVVAVVELLRPQHLVQSSITSNSFSRILMLQKSAMALQPPRAPHLQQSTTIMQFKTRVFQRQFRNAPIRDLLAVLLTTLRAPAMPVPTSQLRTWCLAILTLLTRQFVPCFQLRLKLMSATSFTNTTIGRIWWYRP